MNRKNCLYIILFSLLSSVAFSQISTNSPYSRFGLGSLNSSISSEQTALGGSSVTYFNSNSINFNNPATYSSFQPKSFLFSTAIKSSVHNFSTVDQSQNETNTSFSHLAIGFPINNYVSVSSGLLPYSSVGYNLDYDTLYPDLENAVSISSSGNGGLSEYFVGTAIKLHNTLSVGINASYLFGGLTNNKTANFNNQEIFNVSSVDRKNITGLSYEAGFLFNKEIKKDKYIAVGAIFQNNSELDVKQSILSTTYDLNSTSIIIKDTFQIDTIFGNIVIPNKISVGLSYSTKRLLLVMNYSSQDWSDYQFLANGISVNEDNLKNSICYSGGLQFTPKYNAHNKYWKKINYRLGGRYNKTYLSLRNNQLTEKSLTFGVGLPIKRTNTYYNLSVEVGDKGTTEENLIKEQFIRVAFGVTFKGIWFVKRKYD